MAHKVTGTLLQPPPPPLKRNAKNVIDIDSGILS